MPEIKIWKEDGCVSIRAFLDDQKVGSATLNSESTRMFKLWGFEVVEAYRNRGIGTMLMREVFRQADIHEKGVDIPSRATSVGFFQKFSELEQKRERQFYYLGRIKK